MKYYIFIFLTSLAISVIFGLIFIPLFNKLKLGQPILKYVSTHKNKNGTATMGGIIFIIPACITFFIYCGFSNRISIVSIIIGLAFMIVGFLDDFIKIKTGHNEGLKPYQKIIFQLAIAIIAGFFAYQKGIDKFIVPFSKSIIKLGFWSIFVIIFIFIAMTNSVNLTDGLDGLASNVSICYLFILSILIYFQKIFFGSLYSNNIDTDIMIKLCFSLIGGICGFLVFNTNKATIFMGDTGSLALGGFLASISIFTMNSFFIPILGIMFVLSSISVILQVIYFKRTKKRLFLMAPLHHHFELKGYKEGKIVYLYSLITFSIGILLLLFYL